jgi:tetratricopeptide (TPR) repeat protein
LTSEEWLFDLEGLLYPDKLIISDERLNIKAVEVESYAAVQLFLQGARRVKPKFHMKGKTSTNVVRICQLLEGMPLGIELVSSCEEIAGRIEGNLETLATSMHDMPRRHRSMLTVFDHSWDLLEADEQCVFMKLSIFQGGFDRMAAEKVAGASVGILAKLVDKTLIRIAHSKNGEVVGRYEIHDLLRQYSARKLSLHPNENSRTRESHCKYFSNLLHRKESLLRGADQKAAMEEIGLEIENVRQAWQEACEHLWVEEIHKSLSSLYRFYFVRAWFLEGQEAFERAVKALVGEIGKVDFSNQAVARTVGMLIVRQGIFFGQLARYEEAEGLLQEGLSIHRELNVPVEIAFAHDGLGQVYRMTTRYELAGKASEESLSIYPEIDHRLGVADVLNHLCNLAYRLSDYVEAERYLQQTLEIRREFGDQQGIARCLLNLGTIVYRSGDYQRAEQLARESLSVCKSIGDRWGVAACLNNLGNVAERFGKYVDAQELYEGSLEIKEDIGHRSSIATSIYNLGKIAHHLGENEKSIQLYHQSLRIITEIGNQWSYSNALQGLGIVLLAAGSSVEAEEKMVESLRVAQEIGVVVLQEAGLVGMAEIFEFKGELERAVEILAMVKERPSREKEIQDKADSLLVTLKPQLSSEDCHNAFNRGGKLEFDRVVAELLD